MRSEEAHARVKLSVIIPCFNEEQTLARCVSRVLEITDETLSVEVIVVDDCSSDRSFAIAERLADRHPDIRVLRHRKNRGKGAALRTGIREATGDFVAVQDADLEYDPAELRGLLGPLRDGKADVVLGSRFLGGTPHRVLYFWHYLGNLRDGVRALYCIFRYNAYHLPLPMQFLIYSFLGGVAALVNLVTFLAFMASGVSVTVSAPLAFVVAAAANYFLCVALLFRRKTRWNSVTEMLVYAIVVIVTGALDLGITRTLYALGNPAWQSKSIASLVGLIFNFIGRRFWVFPEKTS